MDRLQLVNMFVLIVSVLALLKASAVKRSALDALENNGKNLQSSTCTKPVNSRIVHLCYKWLGVWSLLLAVTLLPYSYIRTDFGLGITFAFAGVALILKDVISFLAHTDNYQWIRWATASVLFGVTTYLIW